MTDYYIGTCGFTDRGLDGTFYRKGINPAERMAFYAQHFNAVEIDSSYYALPSERNSVLFAQRTPDNFIFHYKAFGLMTKHRVQTKSLGRALSMHLPVGHQAPYVDDPPADMLAKTFDMYYRALLPLNSAGKLGLVLFQFPPYFTKSGENKCYILQCKEWMMDFRLAIEFRHNSWTNRSELSDTLKFLIDNNLTYVSVDEPQFSSGSTVPPIAEATTDTAYVRFHGRNTKNWFKKGGTVAERFDYFYNKDELEEWVPKIRNLAENTSQIHVMFNNCVNTFAVQNARMIADVIGALPDKRKVEIISQADLGI